jgi:hypothetical protein
MPKLLRGLGFLVWEIENAQTVHKALCVVHLLRLTACLQFEGTVSSGI